MTAALQTRLNATVLSRFGQDVLLNYNTVRADFVVPYAGGVIDGMNVEARNPQIIIATNNVPDNVRGKPVVANDVNYIVASHQPDGYGLSTLLLELA